VISGSGSAPDAELFYTLYEGVFKPNLIRIALILDVFTPLSTGPLAAAALATATGASAEGVGRLADYLVASGVLAKSPSGYSLTPFAETFFVRGAKAYAGDLFFGYTSHTFWESVMESLRSGRPERLLERFDQDAWVESYRSSRVSSSLEMWRAAGIIPVGQTRLTVLDLACGCSIKSFSLARAEPSAEVVCVDQPEVLCIARDLAERMGISDRVTLVPGDLLSLPLAETFYDVCLAGQITHYLTRECNMDLFCRVRRALRPGGKFLIDVPMGEPTSDAAAAALSILLWAHSAGTVYPYEAYEQLLCAAGFISIRRLGGRWIVAETPRL